MHTHTHTHKHISEKNAQRLVRVVVFGWGKLGAKKLFYSHERETFNSKSFSLFDLF